MHIMYFFINVNKKNAISLQQKKISPPDVDLYSLKAQDSSAFFT